MSDHETNVAMEETVEAMLSELQARVVGSLMEKQMATPDYYPLTLNALVAACNQKSSRNPVMNLSPQQVVGIINELRHEGLATANTLGRADRFEQQLNRKLKLNNREQAVICTLLLRGAQTANEIRINTNRMAEFADNSEVVDTLQELIEREEPLVLHIPRAAGQREDRYNHLLCGMPEIPPPAASGPSTPAVPASDPGLAKRVEQLEEIVEKLQAEIEALKYR